MLPPLIAAQRALDRGDIGSAQDLVRDATDQARTLLHHPVKARSTETAIREAMAAATRVWGRDLTVELVMPPGGVGWSQRSRRAVVRIGVLETLHNVARHQPGGHARISIANRRGLLYVTVVARSPSVGPDGRPDEDDGNEPTGEMCIAGGFGLAHLQEEIERLGGRLSYTFRQGASVVALTLPRHTAARWASRSSRTERTRPDVLSGVGS